MNPLLDRLRAATEPAPDATDRLRARLAPPSVGPALRSLPDVPAGGLERLRRTVRPPAPRRRWVAIAAGLGIVLLVGGASSLSGTGLWGWRASESSSSETISMASMPTQSMPTPSMPTTSMPTPSMPAKSMPTPSMPTPSMSTNSMPTNSIPTTSAPPEDPLRSVVLPAGVPVTRSGRVATVRWEVGTLPVSVDAPGRAELRLVTREALVALDSASVSLTRDRLGSRLTVRRGRATLTCEGEPASVLDAPAESTCLPTRPAGWLGRAEALREAGAPAADVLVAVDRGLAPFGPPASPDAPSDAPSDAQPSAVPVDPAYAELIALRVDLLLTLGDGPAARAAAARYPSDGPRAAAMRAILHP